LYGKTKENRVKILPFFVASYALLSLLMSTL